MTSSPSPYTINVHAPGGGGGGGANSSGSGQNDNQEDKGRGTAIPGQDFLIMRRRRVTIVPAPRIPKRLLFSAVIRNFGGVNNAFSFIADVLLVPTSFKMDTVDDLYLHMFPASYMSAIRDNIVSLLRVASHGVSLATRAEQCDIPEDLRNRDYQLVVTCPTVQYGDMYAACICQLKGAVEGQGIITFLIDFSWYMILSKSCADQENTHCLKPSKYGSELHASEPSK
ncbi:hypothetical protein BC827DRAFT_1159040 [Russula dissimulans]|nr:hypothetical protein BC827DRAFT_1159040 [Russula dissimulans]